VLRINPKRLLRVLAVSVAVALIASALVACGDTNIFMTAPEVEADPSSQFVLPPFANSNVSTQVGSTGVAFMAICLPPNVLLDLETFEFFSTGSAEYAGWAMSSYSNADGCRAPATTSHNIQIYANGRSAGSGQVIMMLKSDPRIRASFNLWVEVPGKG
jgi:hypothetical protein